VPEVDAVNEEVQVEGDVVIARVQVVNVPTTPVSLRLTVPVTIPMNVPPVEVSVTRTVHVDAWPVLTGLVQLTVVLVVLGLTTMLAVPLLPA
jgi:hypothetical protein